MTHIATTMAVLALCSWLGGCATGGVQQQAPSRLMGLPAVTGMEQVRDPQTGLPFFFPCNPCSEPTPKTPLPIAWVQPASQPVDVAVSPVARPTVPVQVKRAPEPNPAPVNEPDRFVLFEYGAFTLNDRAKQQINVFALESFAGKTPGTPPNRAMPKIYPPVEHPQRTVIVTGQVDNSGSAEANRRIAKLRAEAVKAQLVAAGVPADKIKVEACIDCFAADNNTSAGRRLNRRASIRLVD